MQTGAGSGGGERYDGAEFRVENQQHRLPAALQHAAHCYRLPLLNSAHDRLDTAPVPHLCTWDDARQTMSTDSEQRQSTTFLRRRQVLHGGMAAAFAASLPSCSTQSHPVP